MPACSSSAVLLARPWSGRPASAGGAAVCITSTSFMSLETVDLDGLAIKAQALLLVSQEVLNILALVSLQLDHLSHLGVCDDSAIAGELLLDDFENLLLVELLR
jgi:hypothetical protein